MVFAFGIMLTCFLFFIILEENLYLCWLLSIFTKESFIVLYLIINNGFIFPDTSPTVILFNIVHTLKFEVKLYPIKCL